MANNPTLPQIPAMQAPQVQPHPNAMPQGQMQPGMDIGTLLMLQKLREARMAGLAQPVAQPAPAPASTVGTQTVAPAQQMQQGAGTPATSIGDLLFQMQGGQ